MSVMTADELKTHIIGYLRFKRQIKLCASEIYGLRSKLYIVKRKKPKEKMTRESLEKFLENFKG